MRHPLKGRAARRQASETGHCRVRAALTGLRGYFVVEDWGSSCIAMTEMLALGERFRHLVCNTSHA